MRNTRHCFFDSLAQIPHDRVAYYESPCDPPKTLDLSVGMPNIIGLRFSRIHLPNWFVKLDPGVANVYGKLLHSLKYFIVRTYPEWG